MSAQLLGGAGPDTVLDLTEPVDAEIYTPTDEGLIPTGEIATVLATPFDFRQPMGLGVHIEALAKTPALGYDHNLVLNGMAGTLRQVAELHHAGSGRSMTIETTEPALQVYSGNFLNGQAGKAGATYAKRSAVCLETQHYPDAVHHDNFPSTELAPGETVESVRACTGAPFEVADDVITRIARESARRSRGLMVRKKAGFTIEMVRAVNTQWGALEAAIGKRMIALAIVLHLIVIT